ncbi:hypothetical protein MBLNU457_7054t1 [Dothideomycetes sp. NU457]
MSSRFNPQRSDARSSLFSTYDQTRSRPSSTGPNAYSRPSTNTYSSPYDNQVFGAYPNNSRPGSGLGGSSYGSGGYGVGNGGMGGSGDGDGGGGRKSAQDMRKDYEKKGYNTAMLDELESQNDEQVSEMAKRVGMLKDITLKIGDEIRDSTAFAEKMNDSFGNTQLRLKGTMNRMLRMAEKTGVGWKVWLGFFAAVVMLFTYVWLF